MSSHTLMFLYDFYHSGISYNKNAIRCREERVVGGVGSCLFVAHRAGAGQAIFEQVARRYLREIEATEGSLPCWVRFYPQGVGLLRLARKEGT